MTMRLFLQKKSKIFQYIGENITTAEVDDRYGDLTAPYTVRVNNDTVLDATIVRGLA